MTLPRQAELFDETGQVAFQPAAATIVSEIAAPATPVAAPAARTVPQTIVSVRRKSRTTARVVATTRVVPAVRVASVSKAPSAGRGAVARQLVMSQSISSGREDARWFSVPQRALLPRFQLFEGAAGVTEETGGILRVHSRSKRAQRGCVWFV